MKTCRTCKNAKDEREFHRCSSSKDGLQRNCKSCVKNHNQLYYLNNFNKLNLKTKRYQEENRERVNAIAARWRRDNLAVRNATAARDRADKRNRTPLWLTAKQKVEIKEFYVIAKELSWLSEEKLEVDHIIPLHGKNVSGLHVPWNLQILPASANRTKHNKVMYGR